MPGAGAGQGAYVPGLHRKALTGRTGHRAKLLGGDCGFFGGLLLRVTAWQQEYFSLFMFVLF